MTAIFPTNKAPSAWEVDLTVSSGAIAAACPSCGFWMNKQNPPIPAKPERTGGAVVRIPNGRPKCPGCGVRLNITVTLPD